MSGLEQKIESIPVHELLRRVVSKDPSTLETIQELTKVKNRDDSEEVKKQIAYEQLKNGEYISAMYYFREHEGENDHILVDIADGLISKYHSLVEGDNLNLEMRASHVFHAGIAIGGIKNKELRDSQAIIMGDRIFNEIVKKYRCESSWCALMYSIAGADNRLIAMADHVIDNHRLTPFSIEGSHLKEIFRVLSNFKSFEMQVKKTIAHFTKDEHCDFQIIKELLYAERSNDRKKIKWSKKEITYIAEFAVKKKHYPIIAKLFENYDKYLEQFDKEDIVDKCLDYELEKDGVIIRRNLLYVQDLYDSLKMSKEKIKRLGKKAEGKNEFYFASHMYDRIKDKDSSERMIIKMGKKGFLKDVGVFLADSMTEKGVAINSLRFQKGFYDIFMECLLNSNKDYRYVLLHLLPEVVYDELISIGDALLKAVDDRHDIGNLVRTYIKTEGVLSREKILTLHTLFEGAGEKGIAKNLRKILDDETFEKDRFYLLRKNKGAKLYYLLRDYYDNKSVIEKDDDTLKKQYKKYNVYNLNRLKSDFGLRNEKVVREILENFSPYFGSVRLNKLADKSFDLEEYDAALDLLKKTNNINKIKRLSEKLLRKKQFSHAKQYLEVYTPEEAGKIVSRARIDNIISDLKKDLTKGLGVLITLSENNTLEDIKLGITQDNFYEGKKAKQVSKLSMNSEILDTSVIVKLEEFGSTGEFHDKLEYELLKNLKINKIILPKPVIYGRVNDLNVNVFSVIEGKNLSTIISGNDKLTENNYRLLYEAISFFDIINRQLGITLKKISTKDIDYERALKTKQADLDISLTKKAHDLFGDLGIDKIYLEKTDQFMRLPGTWCKDNNATNIMYIPKKNRFAFIDFNLIEYRPREFDLIKFIDTPNFLNGEQRAEFLSRIDADKEAVKIASEYLNLRHFISRYAIGDVDTARFFAQRSGIKEIMPI